MLGLGGMAGTGAVASFSFVREGRGGINGADAIFEFRCLRSRFKVYLYEGGGRQR